MGTSLAYPTLASSRYFGVISATSGTSYYCLLYASKCGNAAGETACSKVSNVALTANTAYGMSLALTSGVASTAPAGAFAPIGL